MKIFITGAAGFIGGAITKSFVQDHDVFALARSEAAAVKVAKLGAKPIRSDLATLQSQDLVGCEVTIHCAAYAEEWGSYDQFYQANVVGTEKVLTASKNAGVKRFIFIGTEAALFHGQDMLEIDESYPLCTESPYPYSRTKALAEQLVLHANTSEFQTVSLRPRMVWGPNDQSILPALLAMIEKGQFSWIDHGKFQTSSTHIENLVFAVELALNAGKGGEAYFIANDGTVSMKEFLTKYLQTQGVSVPQKSIPKIVARSVGKIIDTAWKILKLEKKPPLVRFSVDIMSAHCTVKTDKAKRELGYQPKVSTEEGLSRMPRLSI